MRAKRMMCTLMAGVVALVGLLLLHSIGFSEEEEAKRKFYESCIVREIARCESKSVMLNSESQKLQEYARTNLQKARFLTEQKDSLIQDLIDEQIPLRDHSIQVYINGRFNEKID